MQILDDFCIGGFEASFGRKAQDVFLFRVCWNEMRTPNLCPLLNVHTNRSVSHQNQAPTLSNG